MSIEVLDPSHEDSSGEFAPAARLRSLEGSIVGVVSNGKKGTKPFFDAFERATIYVSPNDTAIGLSETLNRSKRRLGRLDVEDLPPAYRRRRRTSWWRATSSFASLPAPGSTSNTCPPPGRSG